MMIEVSDSDFQRLKKLAEPFVDTPGSVVARLLDHFEQAAVVEPQTKGDRLPLLAFDLPPLTHAKLLMARFGGREPDRLTWDGLLRLAMTQTAARVSEFGELKRVLGANLVQGEKTDQGYKYLAPLRISYQGVSAEDAMRIVIRASKYLSAICEFEFEWRRKEGAFRPGDRAYGHIAGGITKVSSGWHTA